MKIGILAACGALAIAGTMTVSAQQPPTTSPQTPTPPTTTTKPMPGQTADKSGAVMTVTGCLKPLDSVAGAPQITADRPGADRPAPGGQPQATDRQPADRPAIGTAGAGTAARFALTDVESNDASPAAGKSARKQFVLMADSNVNLSAHVNHKVEITGKSAMPSNPSVAGKDADRHEGAMNKDAWPTLQVTAVKMIAANCGS